MFKRILRHGGLLLALLCASLCCAAASAADIDMERDVTLTIEYRHDGKPVTGAAFDLYYTADVSPDLTFTLAGDFRNYPVDINGGAWSALSATLAGYAQRDDLTPLDSGKTDRGGRLTFPTHGTLRPGLYLVVGHRLTVDGHTFTVEPFLVSLPSRDDIDGGWIYDVTAAPKYEHTYKPDKPDDTVDRKVLKVWEDDGREADRPRQVVVQLLRDGKVYDTVTLSDANNWRYVWRDLDDRYTWTVVEKAVDGYTVTVTKDGITFVVTNTKDTPPDEPDAPDTPPDTPDAPEGPKLPQTGVLWWPVPLMAAMGLLLFTAGFLLRRRDGYEEP